MSFGIILALSKERRYHIFGQSIFVHQNWSNIHQFWDVPEYWDLYFGTFKYQKSALKSAWVRVSVGTQDLVFLDMRFITLQISGLSTDHC